MFVFNLSFKISQYERNIVSLNAHEFFDGIYFLDIKRLLIAKHIVFGGLYFGFQILK